MQIMDLSPATVAVADPATLQENRAHPDTTAGNLHSPTLPAHFANYLQTYERARQ